MRKLMSLPIKKVGKCPTKLCLSEVMAIFNQGHFYINYLRGYKCRSCWFWNAYSNLLSKMPIFSMAWQTFRVLQHPHTAWKVPIFFQPLLKQIERWGVCQKYWKTLGIIHKWRHPWRGGRGVQKLVIWGDFQGIIGVTRGGRGVKNFENWGDVIYGWSLRH